MFNLFQISDPHFGKKFSNTKESRLYSGLNIHDFRLCEALHNFFHEDVGDLDGISDDDQFFLIMNGDLTSKGHELEFQVANTFLHSEHAITGQGRVQMVGLKQPVTADDGRDLYAGIPGNHDHGNGWWNWPAVLGYSPEIYRRLLDAPPFSKQTWCSDSLELCIFGIDSCSMYEEKTLNLAPWASGGFSKKHRTDFRSFLEKELSKPLIGGCEFRTAAILCHHPWTSEGSAGPLCPSCVAWLHGLAWDCGIRIVMTGHTHRSLTQVLESVGPHGKKRVREVRCPTTLQTPAVLTAEYQSPGLWWHRVRVENREIVWEGTLLLYSGSSFAIPETVTKPDDGKSNSGKPVREIWYRETMPSMGG